MPACENLWAFLHGRMRAYGDGLPGSDWYGEVPAKTSAGAPARGAVAGYKVFGPRAVCLLFRQSLWSLCLFPCVSFCLSNCVHLTDYPSIQGTMCSRWELHQLAGLPGGGVGVFRFCHTPIWVNTVWIKQTKQGKTLLISLGYMLPCMLRHAASRDLLSSRCQVPGGIGMVAYGRPWLAGGVCWSKSWRWSIW